MGSAAAGALAEKGLRVAGFDAFTPPHARGSSHGLSRIFRQAYWEDSRYVTLLLRARELWDRLERDSGQPLLHVTGALMIGPQGGQLAPRSAESARAFHLPHEMLSAGELRRRWPVFSVPHDAVALLEHGAGYLRPELCIEQQLAHAVRRGAQLHMNEPVVEWTAAAGGVTIRTARGQYSAGHLVITAGPWAPQVVGEDWPLRVTRQVLFWFEPAGPIEPFREGRLPIYLIESAAGEPVLYGFPITGSDAEGAKVAFHGSDEVCTPETVSRTVRPDEEARIRQRLASALPSLAGRRVRAETCLYTMTPDENFILGLHPQHSAVTVALGFSGHGFKFAPVVGEVIGELVCDGRSRFDLAMFSPGRFSASGM